MIKCGTKLLASKLDDTDREDYINDVTLLGRIKRHRSSIIPKEETKSDLSKEGSPNAHTKEEPIVKQEPGTQQQHDNLASASTSPAPPTGSNKPVSSARLKAMQRRKAKANAKNGANKIRSVDISQSSLSRQMIENGKEWI